MYCSKCGAQLTDDSVFCSACGAPCNPQQQPVSAPANQQSTPMPPAAPGGYYEIQFARIAAGEKAKFNWAAFFLGPFHQLYHGSTKRFKKTYLPYMITAAALYLVQMIATFTTSLTGALMVTALAGILWLALSVWALVLAIGNGRKYNACLYEQTGGNAAAVPKRTKPVCILIAAIVAYGILLAAVSAIGARMMMESWTDSIKDSMTNDDLWIQDESMTEVSGNKGELSDSQYTTELGNGVQVLTDEPWTGAWISATNGCTTWNDIITMDAYLGESTENPDGSWTLLVYDMMDDTLKDGYTLSADYMRLERMGDSEGIWSRPNFEDAAAPLPEEYYGVYTWELNKGASEIPLGVVDAFQFMGTTYKNARPAADGGYLIDQVEVGILGPQEYTTHVWFDENGMHADNQVYEKVE